MYHVSFLSEKVLSFKHTWRAVCARLFSSGSRLWLRTDITQWFVFVLWSVPPENVNGSLVGKCELDVSHVFSFPSAKVYLCCFFSVFLKSQNTWRMYCTLLRCVHTKEQTIEQLNFEHIFLTACVFLWSCYELEETIDRCTITCYWINFWDCTSVQGTGPWTEEWNWIFTGTFLRPAFL